MSAAPPERPAAGDGQTEEMAIGGAGYRPHLDGLRALAVYLVVLFHAGSAFFVGGFVGVDVFFVLSGYLVTQVLWRDLAAGGAIRYGRFYARRFRRLLPAAFVALTATAMMYVAIASPSDVAASVDAFKAAFLYVANWFFVSRSTAYFGGDIEQNPVLHFWSLAVEEQFYLLWPLLLGGLHAAGRARGMTPLRLIRLAVGGGAVASLAWALWLRGGDPVHAYFGTDARAYQLLAGAWLALTPGVIAALRRARRVVRLLAPLAFAGLVVLATSLLDVDAIVRGAAVALVTCLAIAAVEADDGGPTQRLLSTGPIVYLGKISYGTYLWHWPVILVLSVSFSLGTPATVALTAVIASAIASLSFQLFENPIRRSPRLDGHRRAVIAAGLAVSAASALLLMPAILEPGAAAGRPTSAARRGGTPVPGGLDFANATFPALPRPPVCLGKPPGACTVVRGNGPHLLLIGDSHARMLMPTLMELARRENLTLSVVSSGGCLWQRHLYARPGMADCVARKEDAYARVIPALKPDVIIAANYAYEDTHVPAIGVAGEDGVFTRRGTPQFDRLLRSATMESAATLASLASRGLVIVEPIPVARETENPTACLVRARFLEECRYVAQEQPSGLERLYRQLDRQHPKVWSADFDRLVCPWWPVCDPVIGGRIVKVDTHHLTREYGASLATDVADYLKANGLIPAGTRTRRGADAAAG